jgi:hypothetical protein
MFNLSDNKGDMQKFETKTQELSKSEDDKPLKVVGPLTTNVASSSLTGGKKYSKRKIVKRKVPATPSKKFVWRFIIVNGIVKKLKVGNNRKFRGGDSQPLPITTDNDLTQYLLLQPDKPLTTSNAIEIEKYANNYMQGNQNNVVRGGYCGCNKNNGGNVAYDSKNNLLTQASMGGKYKKKAGGSDYKKKLEKLSVDKLKKLAANKHIKITKKKNGAIVYLKKSSIIKKLCEHKK